MGNLLKKELITRISLKQKKAAEQARIAEAEVTKAAAISRARSCRKTCRFTPKSKYG